MNDCLGVFGIKATIIDALSTLGEDESLLDGWTVLLTGLSDAVIRGEAFSRGTTIIQDLRSGRDPLSIVAAKRLFVVRSDAAIIEHEFNSLEATSYLHAYIKRMMTLQNGRLFVVTSDAARLLTSLERVSQFDDASMFHNLLVSNALKIGEDFSTENLKDLISFP